MLIHCINVSNSLLYNSLVHTLCLCRLKSLNSSYLDTHAQSPDRPSFSRLQKINFQVFSLFLTNCSKWLLFSSLLLFMQVSTLFFGIFRIKVEIFFFFLVNSKIYLKVSLIGRPKCRSCLLIVNGWIQFTKKETIYIIKFINF